jgi:hypothetical protein
MIPDLLALVEDKEEEEDLSEFSISPFDPLPSILVHGKPTDLTKRGTFSIMKNLG